MEIDEVIENCFLAHLQVKTHLLRAINGEVDADPQEIRSDRECIVGKWIYGPGAAYSSLCEYHELRDVHKTFHEEAYNALMLKREGNLMKAANYVKEGPFQCSSLALQDALMNMRKQARSLKNAKAATHL